MNTFNNIEVVCAEPVTHASVRYSCQLYPDAKSKPEPIKLPKKLATTLGVELTYLPYFYEQVYKRTGILLGNDSTADEDIRRKMLYQIIRTMDKKGVDAFKKSMDPQCIEIPTRAMDCPKELIKNIKDITAVAKQHGGMPVVSYSVAGGGAHIHSGIPNDAPNYRKHMMAFAANNPWLSWAFAGYSDNHNACPVLRKHIYANGGSRDVVKEARHKRAQAYKELHAVKNDIVEYTRYLCGHTTEYHASADNYGDSYTLRYINSTRRELMGLRRKMLNLKKLIATPLPKKQNTNLIAVSGLGELKQKNYCVVSRSCTMEFRAFRMLKDMRKFNKYILLVNRIVEYVKAQCANDLIPVPGYSEDDYTKLRDSYRAQCIGFNKMLDMLGLDREHFRAERVNMALRIRWARKSK